jgi:hypothetical protein
MRNDYKTICQECLLKNLPERTREVISRRFGLEGERETLEAVGEAFGITRERVRQIESDGLRKLSDSLSASVCQKILKEYASYLKKNNSIKREDLMLAEFGGDKFQNHVFFLLTLAGGFFRIQETENFHAFWTTDKKADIRAEKTIQSFISKLQKIQKPIALPFSFPSSYVEVSRRIVLGPRGLYGLKEWPEVNPKGIKDKAYIVLKEEEKPLHFTEVATLINSSTILNSNKTVIPQTVHNELIKDPRFVLVGRGLYGLKEWGYEPGVVRDVIYREIKNSGRALPEQDIVKRVLDQRRVQPSTILLNLRNRKYFAKDQEGRYTIRKV